MLLALLMSVAISMLLLSLQPPQSRDYVYAAFFLICATPLLKIRWFVGTTVLVTPVLLAAASHLRLHPAAAPVRALLGIAAPASSCAAANGASGPCAAAATAALPWEAVVHLVVAWAVGGLMAFLSDSNRRQAFANHALALSAAEKELAEVRARAGVERELAAAQAQVRWLMESWSLSILCPFFSVNEVEALPLDSKGTCCSAIPCLGHTQVSAPSKPVPASSVALTL